MNKYVSIVAAAAAFSLFGGMAALGQDPPAPIQTTTEEPPGDNCPDGGVKVTTVDPPESPDPTETAEPDPTEEPTEEPTPDDTPDPEPTDTPDPDPEPTPTDDPDGRPPIPTPTPSILLSRAAPEPEGDVYYICNGQQGDPGDDGFDGSDGADGVEPEPPLQATSRRACRSAKVRKLKLPARYRKVRSVRVYVNGRRKSVSVRKRTIRVDLRKLPCGYYPVLVSHRGVKPVLKVYRLRG